MRKLKEETDYISHRLNAARYRGDIDFTSDVDVEEKNGNKYLEVECTDAERARDVQEFLEELETEHYTNTGIRNTAEGRYVYVVAYNI